jgi:hypothetical protein
MHLGPKTLLFFAPQVADSTQQILSEVVAQNHIFVGNYRKRIDCDVLLSDFPERGIVFEFSV